MILDPPKNKQGCMNRYSMNETHVLGNACENEKNIDKNEIIMVYLSKDKCDNEYIQMMSDISNRNISYNDLKNQLADKYGIFVNEQFEMEVSQMCNYGSYVFNEGKLEGIYDCIINSMKNFKVDFEQAVLSLELDEEVANACRKRYEEENKKCS